MNYGFLGSFQKFFDIISLTTTSTIQYYINYKTKNYTFKSEGVDKIVLGESFFRGDICHACGNCCKIGFLMFLTSSDYKYVPKEKINLFTELQVGNKVLYTAENNSSCPFQIGIMCEIQQSKPIHCQFPHIKIREQRGVTRTGMLYKAPYARRWAKKPELRCPINSTDFLEYDLLSRQQDIRILQHLVRIQEDLGLNTNLVLSIIERINNYTEQKSKEVINQGKLF